MTISTIDDLINSFCNKRQKMPFGKITNLSGQSISFPSSFWKLAGAPGVGATPTSAATCNNTTLGGIPWNNPTGLDKTYISKLSVGASNPGSYEVHDRLAHMGGLSGLLTSSQSVGLSLVTLSSTDNIAARIISSDYSRVQWYLEWYVATGGALVTATVTYTNQSGTTGQTISLGIPSTMAIGRMIPIIPNAGDSIRSIESIQLSASTGSTGNFGVTARVQRAELSVASTNYANVMDWTLTALPQIYDSSCIEFISGSNPITSPSSPQGAITLIQG